MQSSGTCHGLLLSSKNYIVICIPYIIMIMILLLRNKLPCVLIDYWLLQDQIYKNSLIAIGLSTNRRIKSSGQNNDWYRFVYWFDNCYLTSNFIILVYGQVDVTHFKTLKCHLYPRQDQSYKSFLSCEIFVMRQVTV